MSFKKFITGGTFFKQLAIALIALLVIAFAMLKWLNFSTNHGQEIPVPNLSKQTIEEASQKLAELDLDYVVLDTVDFRAEYPPYSVIQQDPLPEVTVKQNRKIYVKVNAGGYNTIVMPDLIQKTYRQALPTIKAIGLEEGNITYVPYLAKDIVLEMKQKGKKLMPGDKVLKASKIDLVLGDGKTGFDENDTIQ